MRLLWSCAHRTLSRQQRIYPVYRCNWKRREGLATKDCVRVRSDLLDDAMTEAVFKALRPAELELVLAALQELEQRDQAYISCPLCRSLAFD